MGSKANSARQILPWAGSVVLVSYLFYTSDIDSIGKSLFSVDLPAFLALALIATLAAFIVDTLGVRSAISAFQGTLPLREAMSAKATSYFLNILNYNAALAGMALYLKKSRGFSFLGSLGSLLLLNIADLLSLLVVMGLGLLLCLGDSNIDGRLKVFAGLVSAGGLLAFLAALLLVKSRLPSRLLAWPRRQRLLQPALDASWSLWGRLVLLRVLLLGVYICAQFFFMRVFGIETPVGVLLFYVPMTTFIQIIPLSIAGLGTTQFAMREFYAPFVVAGGLSAAGVVDACSTTSIFGFVFFRILLASFFMGDLSRQVLKDTRAGSDAAKND